MKTDRFMKNMRIALLLMAVGLMSVSCEEEKLEGLEGGAAFHIHGGALV